ncbi:MAG: hypothetical protein RBS80_20270 [Thermoguttaceae bacterium]|jgi:hypothetical protein|nr:hypothetical protein [Thermoguttaceae bacterium]
MMMAYRQLTTWTVMLWLVSLGAGCGRSGSDVKTVAVSGTVYLDDQPLEGITVVFIGENARFVGMGETGPDGKYRLDYGSIPRTRGAMPGMNRVYFTVAAEDEGPPMIPDEVPKPKDNPVPPKYCDPANPQLTFDVPARGSQEADFRLSSR